MPLPKPPIGNGNNPLKPQQPQGGSGRPQLSPEERERRIRQRREAEERSKQRNKVDEQERRKRVEQQLAERRKREQEERKRRLAAQEQEAVDFADIDLEDEFPESIDDSHQDSSGYDYLDETGDETFEQIPFEEIHGEYEEDTTDYSDIEVEEAAKPEHKIKRRMLTGKPPELQKPEVFQEPSEFIDKGKKKIKPFGGTKSLKNKEISKLDPRANKEKQAKIIRNVIVIAVVLMVVLSAYRTIFPPASLSVQDVEEIAALAAGETGYPLERAKGFATSFIETYLTIDRGNPEAIAAVEYFYGGSQNVADLESRRSSDSSIQQSVLHGPDTYEVTAIDSASGSFIIGAFVKTVYSDATDDEEATTSTDWIFFQVNVFYNEEEDSLAITPDSPTLTERPSTVSGSEVPEAESLGEQVDAEIENAIRPTVMGFLQGYATVTPDDASAIQQYIINDAPPELKKGLEGRYTFENTESPESSVSFVTYLNPDGEYRVAITVNWKSVVPGSDEAGVTYTSEYVMRVRESGDGQFLVSRFAPMSYVQAADEA